MQQHNSDNQAVDVQSTSSVNAPQMQRQQVQVISPARTTVDMSGTNHQGILYQESMQNIQSPQPYPSQGSAVNTINVQQHMTEWAGDARFVHQPVRYSSAVPLYDFRGQLLAPANIAIHPANVNQFVQYTYGSPQQRPSQGPVAQFTPWPAVFTPSQGLAWVPGGIQGTAIEGQGNQILSRNLPHDNQPGIFIHNGQAQLQQLKQMDGQHASVPKNAIAENFSPTVPNSIGTVNNMRTQQQAQMQALQSMRQSQKVDAKTLTKNPVRLASSTTSLKNSYHTNATLPVNYPLPQVQGNTPGQTARAVTSSSSQESKRMKQFQTPEESSRKESMTYQQTPKRYQQMQGNHGPVAVSVSIGIPATIEGVAVPVRPTRSLLRNMIPITEPITGVSSTIQILPGPSVAQGVLTSSPSAVTTSQQQMEKEVAEYKKSHQQPISSANGHDRPEEANGTIRDSGKHTKEKSELKEKESNEVEVIYEEMDVDAKSDQDNNDTTPSKATVLVKPQIMSCSTEGTSEPVSSCKNGEDEQTKSEVDEKISNDDDKEVNGKAAADSEKENFLPLNKPQTKPNLSKWTVADVYEFIRTVPGCSEYAEDFVAHDIDGEALMLLKTDHLVSAMSMTLGPAMKIISRIDAMREDTESPAE